MKPSMAGYHLISTFRSWTNENRRQHTICTDAFYQFLHLFVIYHLEGMVLKWKDISDLYKLGTILHLRHAKQFLYTFKMNLGSEIEFMDNYINLMALRCNEMTKVEKHLESPSRPVEVAPLLFISLVENAFKHGVNARYPSFVKVSMEMEGDDLVFVCDNSRFEKQGTDRIGSGIGLENMKRRLELLYPGRYTYEQNAADDTYHVKVTLKAL